MSTLLTLVAPRFPLLCFTKLFAVLVLLLVCAAKVVVHVCVGGGGVEEGCTVTGTVVHAEVPQLSHSWTTVLYLPGASVMVVSSFAPLTTYTRLRKAV